MIYRNMDLYTHLTLRAQRHKKLWVHILNSYYNEYSHNKQKRKHKIKLNTEIKSITLKPIYKDKTTKTLVV